MRLHASCISFGGAGVLLLGVPGSGKSSLALRMIERGWGLVADDQVDLAAGDDGLMAAAPAGVSVRTTGSLGGALNLSLRGNTTPE